MQGAQSRRLLRTHSTVVGSAPFGKYVLGYRAGALIEKETVFYNNGAFCCGAPLKGGRKSFDL